MNVKGQQNVGMFERVVIFRLQNDAIKKQSVKELRADVLLNVNVCQGLLYFKVCSRNFSCQTTKNVSNY